MARGACLYYTYKEILNALKVKGQAKHISLLMIVIVVSELQMYFLEEFITLDIPSYTCEI